MAILEMKVPSPGESITEVEIATWLVKDGDFVEKDQPIAEVDSDKATLELPAEQSGVITLKAEEGEVVQVGQVVCLIDMDAAKPEGGAAPAATETKDAGSNAKAPKAEEKVVEKPQIVQQEEKKSQPAQPAATYATGTPSPAAKKILDEKGVEASQVQGSGRDGRITKSDAETASVPAMGSVTSTSGSRAQTTTKLSVLRRKLASRLVSVKNETAMLTTFNEVDMSEIFRIRKQYKDEFSQKHGVGLGVDLIRVVDPRRQVGVQVLDDLGLHLRLRRGLLAPVVDLQLAAGEPLQQRLGYLLDSVVTGHC